MLLIIFLIIFIRLTNISPNNVSNSLDSVKAATNTFSEKSKKVAFLVLT